MPNWCETNITFMSNGTTDGDNAIKDFNKKLCNIIRDRNKKIHLFEADVEESLLRGNYIPFYKRGYIEEISEVQNNTFQIVEYDAWAPNISFWFALLKVLYNNLIEFEYIASEPGCGIYQTNSMGMLPRYYIAYYSDDYNDLTKIPGIWNESKSELFRSINTENPYVHCYSMKNYNSSLPYFLDLEAEGDEDEIIDEMKEYILDPSIKVNDIDSLKNELDKIGIVLNEFTYHSIEDCVSDEARIVKDDQYKDKAIANAMHDFDILCKDIKQKIID